MQSLGNVRKATMVSFIRQIILFIPIACFRCIYLNKGIFGVLQAGPIADSITFVIAIFVFGSEYHKLSKADADAVVSDDDNLNNKYTGKRVVITISREYGSGGRYVGRLLADKMGIKFYDKDIINMVSKESGLGVNYIINSEQKLVSAKFASNNDDRIFISYEKVIKKIAHDSCVIIGRCADYILRKNKSAVRVFLYSDMDSKVKRCVKYYGVSKDSAVHTIMKTNKERAKHYKYYTDREWNDFNNYDLVINVDSLGVEKTASVIWEFINLKNKDK